MRLGVLLLAAVLPAFAQEPGVQRELILRQQQSDSFQQQLRQSQERVATPPAARPALDARQLSERQQLDNVSAQQLRDVQAIERPQELRAYDRQKAADERLPFRTGPIVEVPVRPAPRAEPILPAPDGIRLESPR